MKILKKKISKKFQKKSKKKISKKILNKKSKKRTYHAAILKKKGTGRTKQNQTRKLIRTTFFQVWCKDEFTQYVYNQ